MIISASRRTDIPAFFGDWFKEKIQEGFFLSKNPFNPNQIKKVSLAPEDVDIFAFWTKNPEPFIKNLKYLDENNFKYFFLFTLNSYPKFLEPEIPSFEKRVETFLNLSQITGFEKIIWRYDPIILSSETPMEFHLKQIDTISSLLKGSTTKVKISFVEMYKKVIRRFNKIEISENIKFYDPAKEKKKEIHSFLKEILKITKKNNIEPLSCSDNSGLTKNIIPAGSCIDGDLIKRILNSSKEFPGDKNQRGNCLCSKAVDMGSYNTCSFKCSYCYANR